jgi:hypothetical protein
MAVLSARLRTRPRGEQRGQRLSRCFAKPSLAQEGDDQHGNRRHGREADHDGIRH